MPSVMARQEPCILVIPAARADADGQVYHLPSEKIVLGLRMEGGGDEDAKREGEGPGA